MSIEESTSAITRRDAADRASRVSTMSEALTLIKRAKDSGDSVMVEALQNHIAVKWPLPKTDWLAKLAQTNTKLIAVLSDFRRDPFVKKLSDAASRGEVTREYANNELAKIVASPRYLPVVEAITTEASNVQEKSGVAFDSRYNSLTTISGDVNSQLLAEMRTSKLWERLKSDMANMDNGHASAHLLELFKHGDLETRYMIRNEAPSYMRTRGLEDFDSALLATLTTADADLNRDKQEKIASSKYAASTLFNARYVREQITKLPSSTAPSLRDDEAALVRTF